MKIKPKIHSMTFQDTRWIKFLYVKSVGSITSLDLVTSENVIVTRFRFIYFLNRLNRICLCLECICTRTSSSPRFLPFRDLPFGYCCCLVAVLFLLLRCCGKVAHLSRNQKKKKRKKKIPEMVEWFSCQQLQDATAVYYADFQNSPYIP